MAMACLCVRAPAKMQFRPQHAAKTTDGLRYSPPYCLLSQQARRTSGLKSSACPNLIFMYFRLWAICRSVDEQETHAVIIPLKFVFSPDREIEVTRCAATFTAVQVLEYTLGYGTQLQETRGVIAYQILPLRRSSNDGMSHCSIMFSSCNTFGSNKPSVFFIGDRGIRCFFDC